MKKHSPTPHFSTNIPVGYDKKSIRVLPCNPTLAYVYWEIPFTAKRKSDTLVLRVSTLEDDTSSGEIISTSEVAAEKHSTYIETPTGTAHLIELGTLTVDGSFTAICSTTFMPPSLSADAELPSPDFSQINATADSENDQPSRQTENGYHPEENPPFAPPAPQQETVQPVFPNPSSWINK